jgi:metal-responsive CopG/Arc/MetJ family transcriptional regulator
MNASITLPDALFESADQLATRLGLSRNQLFERALLLVLAQARNQSEDVTAALNAVYGRSDRKGELDELLMHLQCASLPRGDW